MAVLTDAQRRLLDDNDHGVVATQGRDGRPRQSVVYYVRDGERLLISTHDRSRERGPLPRAVRIGHLLVDIPELPPDRRMDRLAGCFRH
jgi:hypothetical protein